MERAASGVKDGKAAAGEVHAVLAAPALLDWSPRLATGIELLDAQHREIFRWFAELDTAAAEQRTLLAVYTMTRLNRYMLDHFAAEEAVMRAAGFPGLARHVAQHHAFRERLRKLKLESAGRDAAAATGEFLRMWLIEHIHGYDMEYVPYLGWLNERPRC